jgi:competence protein ComGC
MKRTTKLLKTNRGATLVEVMVVIGIVTLICGVLLMLVNGSLSTWSASASTAYADSSASIAVQKLAHDIRDGASASLDGSALVVVFPATLSDTGGNGETLYSPGASGVTKRYLLSNGNLIRRVGGTDTILARGMHSVDFSATLGVVTVTIVAREQVGKSTTSKTSTTRVTLRNYR